MDELKPCPWCRKNDLLECEATEHGEEKRPHGCRWTAKVTCLRCSASINTHGFHWTEEEAKADAIEAWNRRVSE